MNLPKRSAEFHEESAGNELMLIAPGGGTVHVLNGTARAVWRMCDGRHSVDAIVNGLRDMFAVPEDHDVHSDVRVILEDFTHKGLIPTA